MTKNLEQFIVSELKDIKNKLDNHITHIAGDIAGIKADICWLKDKSGKNGNGKESKDDIKAQQDVDWLKRFFWIQIGLVLTLIGLMLQHILFKS